MANITIIVNDDKTEKMKYFYQDFIKEVNNPYLIFCAKIDGCVINLYTSKKCTFQGENALDEALIWKDLDDLNISETPKSNSIETNIIINSNKDWEILENHIGSDEVGTGDFFGPIVVCGCYVEEKDINFINSLGVKDSKKLSDDKIREIGKLLMEKLTYSCLVCDNKTYNTQIQKGLNMNSIKAILHNRVFFSFILCFN
jgi:ribonuclease HIII